jgi:hypothetical protein
VRLTISFYSPVQLTSASPSPTTRIVDLGLTRGDAIKQFYMGRRRAIAIFRRAEMECYPLPVQYDWITEYHIRRRLLVDNFKTIVGAKQERASYGAFVAPILAQMLSA